MKIPKRYISLAAVAAMGLAFLYLSYRGATFDIEEVITSGGVLIVALIAFAETGFLIGTVLPGDSLLLSAGIIASQGTLPIIPLIVAIAIAGIAAYVVAYHIGAQAGKRLFKREDGILFRKSHVERAQKFYDRYGAKSLIIARFIPMIRSIAPLVAGVAKLPMREFMIINIIGSVIWATSITLLGYWLGQRIPGLEDYLKYFIAGAVGVALLSVAWQLFGNAKTRKASVAAIKKFVSEI